MRPLHVLVVEDEPDSREVAVISLASAGYQVTACANGQEAVDLCEKPDSRYDVVLMDLAMPVMNGFEATRRLRANDRTRDALIMVVSSYAQASERQRGREAGCDDFLAKPFRRKGLLEALARALGRRAGGE